MRRVGPPQLPDGAVDLRILGDVDAPAILSLIAPDDEQYAITPTTDPMQILTSLVAGSTYVLWTGRAR